MHATANALPMPSTGPSLGTKWIRANLLIAVIFTLAGLLAVATDTLLGVNRSPAVIMSLPMKSLWISAIIGFAMSVASFTAYGALTGSVLREKLPAFSKRTWIALHGAIGAALAAFVAYADLTRIPVGSTESAVAPGGRLDVAFVAALILVAGPALGALFGTLQALVLRPAARGVLAWIAWFVAAGVAIMIFAAVLSFFNPMRWQSDLAFHVARQGSIFVGLMLIAIAMLPALHRLTPRN